jgi:hypothetical protein
MSLDVIIMGKIIYIKTLFQSIAGIEKRWANCVGYDFIGNELVNSI